MKNTQEIEWKKFSENKPNHNDFVVFFIKDKDSEEKDDLVFYFGQFKHPYMMEPAKYKETWMYFAVLNNKMIDPDDSTMWVSLTEISTVARGKFMKEIFSEK